MWERLVRMSFASTSNEGSCFQRPVGRGLARSQGGRARTLTQPRSGAQGSFVPRVGALCRARGYWCDPGSPWLRDTVAA